MELKGSGQITLTDVTDGYSVQLSENNFTFQGNGTGVAGTQYVTTTIDARCGSERVNASVNVNAIVKPQGITIVTDGATPSPTLTITATSAVTSDATINIPIVLSTKYGNLTFTRQFSYTISDPGFSPIVNIAPKTASGETVVSITDQSGTHTASIMDGRTYSLIVDASAISKSESGVYTPQSITLTAKEQKGDLGVVDYSGRFVIETTTNMSTWTTVYESQTNESTKTYTVPANIGAVRCSLFLAGGVTNLLDRKIVPVVLDGSNAYTIILDNDSHTFPGDTDSAIDSSATCGIIAYKGATQIPTTIGNISGMVTGMTVSKSGSGTTNASFTVNVTQNTITPNGVLTVPVTVDGKTFNKKFSYSIAFKGAPGLNQRTIFLYHRSASTPSPAAPSAEVEYDFAQNTLTPASALGNWSMTIPDATNNPNPCWVITASASTAGSTDRIQTNEWSAPIKLASDGASGLSQATIYLYQRANTVTPVSQESKYNFANGKLFNTNDVEITGDVTLNPGWKRKIDTSNSLYPVWVTTASAIGSGTTVTLAATAWSAPVKLAQDGDSVTLTEVYYAVSASKTVAPTSGWSTEETTAPDGQYVWMKIITTYADSSREPDESEPVVITGDKGFSPTVTIEQGDGVTSLEITDVDGTQTADIYDGEDAYTVILDNESHVFEGDSEKAISGQSVVVNMTAMKGETSVNPTITSVTGVPNGMTATIASDRKSFTVRISANSNISSGGILTVTATVDGHTFTKMFSYSVALSGEDGKSVSNLKMQYILTDDDTTVPSQSDSRWSNAPPAYLDGCYYWTRIVTTLDNGTTSYSTPTLNTGLTTAFEEASEALTSANGKNKIFYKAKPAPTSSGNTLTAGDIWYELGTSTDYASDGQHSYNGKIIGMYKWSGSQWIEQELTTASFAFVDAGDITVGKLQAIQIWHDENNYWDLSTGEFKTSNGTFSGTIKAGEINGDNVIIGRPEGRRLTMKNSCLKILDDNVIIANFAGPVTQLGSELASHIDMSLDGFSYKYGSHAIFSCEPLTYGNTSGTIMYGARFKAGEPYTVILHEAPSTSSTITVQVKTNNTSSGNTTFSFTAGTSKTLTKNSITVEYNGKYIITVTHCYDITSGWSLQVSYGNKTPYHCAISLAKPEGSTGVAFYADTYGVLETSGGFSVSNAGAVSAPTFSASTSMSAPKFTASTDFVLGTLSVKDCLNYEHRVVSSSNITTFNTLTELCRFTAPYNCEVIATLFMNYSNDAPAETKISSSWLGDIIHRYKEDNPQNVQHTNIHTVMNSGNTLSFYGKWATGGQSGGSYTVRIFFKKVTIGTQSSNNIVKYK